MKETEQTNELGVVMGKLSTLMAEASQYAANYGAIAPSDDFLVAQNWLGRKDFDVVVCGEAKQGKTSFINALIGRELLPTKMKIATSQVFRITNCPDESYHVVFEDGSREAITKDQMTRYGTETGEQLLGDPLLSGRTIRWIEVNIPMKHLPENIHLLDTPGLGGLYAEHANITYRYVAQADAVIFIKKSDKELTVSEKEFLDQIFSVTQNVLFVMSQTDLYEEDKIQDLAAANADLVKKHFGEKVKRQFVFWPTSSENFVRATDNGDEILMDLSGFPALMSALEMLFTRSVGFTGAYLSCAALDRYYSRALTFAQEQSQVLNAQGPAIVAKLRADKTERKQAFDADWGSRGRKITSIRRDVETIFTTGKSKLQSVFAQGCKLQNEITSEIDNLPNDKDEMQSYCDALPSKLTNRVTREFTSVINDMQDRLNARFSEFRESFNTAVDSTGGALAARTSKELPRPAFLDCARMAAIQGTVGGTVGSMLGVAVAIGTGGLGAPLIPLLAKGGALIGAWCGWSGQRKRAFQAARDSLHREVNTLFVELRSQFSFSETVGVKSPMDAELSRLQAGVDQCITNIVATEARRLKEEFDQLDADAAAKGNELNQKREQNKVLITELTTVRGSLGQVQNDLLAFDAAHAL